MMNIVIKSKATQWLCVGLLLLAAPVMAHPKIAAGLENLSPNSQVDVIVQFDRQPDAVLHKKVARLGGKLRLTLDVINAGAYTIRVNRLERLANDASVVRISPDSRVKPAMQHAAPAVNATAAWTANFTGANLSIAIIDSGISAHFDFSPEQGNPHTQRVVYQENFVRGETTTADLLGHGTHVAGIAGGNGRMNGLYRGIAPNVNLVNLRVLNRNGESSDSVVIAAISRAVALRNTHNIRVINLSLGRPVVQSYKTDPLCLAVEAAWNAGIVVVVAAGNEGRDYSQGTNGYGTIRSPGNDPFVITVGAM
ncbi:MAG: S8 family serine peptidase, partial [Bryobacter sp.]|nr:S8 family serine peptidase [Bryobacter sp. CoA8 C33]